MRLLAIGDSSAAAVGIDHTEGSIAPQMARKIHTRENITVAWHISGHNSAVAGELRDHVLPNIPRNPFHDDAEDDAFTHIVIMLGVNDIKNWHSVRRWKKEFGTFLYALRTRYPEAKLFWHQAIDLTQSPALPEPLGWIMNLRKDLINRKGAQLCVERGAVCIPPLPVTTVNGYCKDGFHANELGYDIWSDHLLNFLQLTPRESPAVQEFLD